MSTKTMKKEAKDGRSMLWRSPEIATFAVRESVLGTNYVEIDSNADGGPLDISLAEAEALYAQLGEAIAYLKSK